MVLRQSFGRLVLIRIQVEINVMWSMEIGFRGQVSRCSELVVGFVEALVLALFEI